MVRMPIGRIIFTVICIACINVHAQLLYETNADGISVTITGYANTVPSEIVLPAIINNLTVTAIGESALSDLPGLTNVSIPNTVTEIEAGAFEDSGLTSVTIPYGVTNIGSGAFTFCENLSRAIIPESVTTIGDAAFDSTALASVTISASTTNFGLGVFVGCEDLTNITIEFGVADIASNTFIGCDLLSSVVIPGSVTNIGIKAFLNCTNLNEVFFLGDAPTVNSTAFQNHVQYGFHDYLTSNYYTATAYYLPGTTGWDQFMTNTLMAATDDSPTNVFVPAVEWNPTIQASGTNFGIQNGQYGFDVTATTNLPIAIEACDDLTQTNWVVLERLTLTNGLYHFSEPFNTNNPARFYRIGFP